MIFTGPLYSQKRRCGFYRPDASCQQVDETTCIKPACSLQLAASLLTTCNRLVIIKLEQAMRTHPDIGLVIADLLQLARFWLCRKNSLELIELSSINKVSLV